MNIYKVSQSVNNGYDTYDSFVIAAKDEVEARNTSPSDGFWEKNQWWFLSLDGEIRKGYSSTWCDPSDCTVELIGVADRKITQKTIILTSFNAG